MADRILTKGLKTGTGVGGIKYILRKGLVPPMSPSVDVRRHIIQMYMRVNK